MTTQTTQPDHPKILLVDFDDARRETRVRVLESRGYEVTIRNDYIASEALDHEDSFDLMILALHRKDLKKSIDYTNRVQRAKPDLPILLLTDAGVYAPKGTLSKSVETDGHAALLASIAEMFDASSHIRELEASVGDHEFGQ